VYRKRWHLLLLLLLLLSLLLLHWTAGNHTACCVLLACLTFQVRVCCNVNQVAAL
jgi:hypothetical protein